MEVVVGSVVEGLDHHLLSPFSREEDEGDVMILASDPFQKRYAVHLGHHIIGDYHVIMPIFQLHHSLFRRLDGIYPYILGPLEEDLRDLKHRGVVIYHQNSNHGSSPASLNRSKNDGFRLEE